MRKCSVSQCTKLHLAKGYCTKHYYRLKRTGNAESCSQMDKRKSIVNGNTIMLPLGIGARRGYAIVDQEYKYLENYRWSLGSRGYPTAYIKGEVKKLHHVIAGKPPQGLVTDHINQNKLDSRKCNLRHITSQENSQNVDWTKRIKITSSKGEQ